MSKPILAAIPIKPFGIAKRRLRGRLDTTARSRLGKAIAAHTADAAVDAGALVAVVTADPAVAHWAQTRGHLVIDENLGAGVGLDRAASAVTATAAHMGRPWAVVHADLPLVTPASLVPVFTEAEHGAVLVPSYNGGTNLIAASATSFHFSYGVGSFQRHLAQNHGATVITDPRLALDLDTEMDLDRALVSSGAAWLRDLLGIRTRLS